MKIIVLGAGVIGMTTAYYLHERGHEVTVVDRGSGPAMETSFGNAGGVCPGFAGPWAAPGMPLKAAKWMFQSSAPLLFRPRMDVKQWSWLARFLRNCSSERFALNKERMQRIAQYSKQCLVRLREETQLVYDNKASGVLQLFQTESELDGGARSAAVLERFAVAHRIVDQREALMIEPALARARARFVGGLYLPDDETGDCYIFTQRLCELLERRGVRFRFDTAVLGLNRSGERIDDVRTSRGAMTADAYVVALGPHAPEITGPVGIDLPVYPVKGYSLTAAIADDDAAPRSSVMDEHSKVMITRLGSRLRAAGMAEVVGFDRRLTPASVANIRESARALFPEAADYERCTFWTGFRPMTPDGPPYLGATGLSNLYLNAGQGSNGWTQACGCGRIVADIVSGREADIDITGMTLDNRG